ncbi:hypothetical protein HBH56_245660 [Parastagonospora nodorum]|nr:hypothetical protein HBH56_245660 [Parastagonospora nodorum]KAH3921558.1 hypothetical protein HBH54_238450 [Parastagonospora nodorum]KAH4138634.1 hypothetical protein HBH45_109350 [Parastagonospora nodorum]KAH4163592.1 hypothetical protein HBH44_084700 [Parastagonospora nodorum]KAH4584260.1 hypothetical protein HBH84_014260 [Parastagonospora nodorum]
MCAKDDLIGRKSLFPNHVNTFSLDFAFSFAAYTLLARFIPTTKIRDSLLKTLENVAKSRILLACVDRRIKQCYLTICAILANYEEQVLLTSVKKNRYCMRCTVKHYNFNIHVSLATDILYLLLKGLVMKMLDFMQDMLDDIYSSKQKAIIQQLIAVVSLLFILKVPFALHFIRAVCDLVILAQYKSYNKDTLAYIQGALERINIFKEKFRLYLILIIINYICYDKDRKHIAYIRVFSKVLLFNNNRQINNTTKMLSTLQAFKFYNLSTIICLVHLVLRDLPNLTTCTTMSYYVNNYIN